MTSKEWEDICISFDEYGMQPATLCNNDDEVINHFRKAFKNVLKDLEVLEILKKTLNNSFLCLIKNKEEQEKVKEWLKNEKNNK